LPLVLKKSTERAGMGNEKILVHQKGKVGLSTKR